MTNYTTIDNDLRKELGLDFNEFAVAILISNLSTNENNSEGGWCYMTKREMAKTLLFSTTGLMGIVERLIKQKIIERHPATKHLRPINKDLFKKVEQRSRKLNNLVQESCTNNSGNQAQLVQESCTNNNNKNYIQEILEKFNTTFSKRYKTIGDTKNFEYWLSVYSKEEVCEAISAATKDDYWKNIITPTILFRTKDKNGDVDRIGDFLNKKTAPVEYKVIGGQDG